MQWVLLVLVVCVVAVAVLGGLAPKSQSLAWPVRAHDPLSDSEQVLYWRLREAFPQHVVLSQVALSQLVQVDGVKDRQAVFNRISQLVADFVVCTKAFEVVAIIELDDRSHETAGRAAADARKTQALQAAGYKLVRLHVSRMPTVVEIKTRVSPPAADVVTAGAGLPENLKARGAFG